MPSPSTPKLSRQEVLKIFRRIPHAEEQTEAVSGEYEEYQKQLRKTAPKSTSKDYSSEVTLDLADEDPFFRIAGYKRFEESAIVTMTGDERSVVREARRKAVVGVSDETLYACFAYTRIILGLINRLDLDRKFRKH
ncbi:MAG: hypothetical protein LAO07_08705 [Acidobacteriia bacterium]|nr:hypothetical protein [Terriglobia bacterium]